MCIASRVPTVLAREFKHLRDPLRAAWIRHGASRTQAVRAGVPPRPMR
jgi:hypothetical protein